MKEKIFYKHPTQLRVSEHISDEETQICAAIGYHDKIIFCDNGNVADVNADCIAILEEYPWIDISDAVIGD